MRTDRELLELAAKAAGIGGGWGGQIEYHNGAVDLRNMWILNGDEFIPWNPLTDDGDALRLAVQLGLNVQPYFFASEKCQKPATAIRPGGGMISDLVAFVPEHNESFEKYDPCAATRRAIVRAAAGIEGSKE